MVPLQTPLQPQISASSERAATAATGSSARAALEGLTENQRLAQVRDVGALLEQVEIPGAVGGIAVENGAYDLVVAQNDALVDAARRVAQHHFVIDVAFGEIAGREQIDAGDLELGRE